MKLEWWPASLFYKMDDEGGGNMDTQKEIQKLFEKAESESLPVQVSEKGSVIVGGVEGNTCERCGGMYQRRTMWFSGESAPHQLAWDYCRPCIKIVEFEKRNIFQAPFQYPQWRPKI